MVTMVQVSQHAGVSTATVSRVLNSPELVDRKTREAVQESIQQLGYRPNQIARGLASRSSRTIGVVVNTFASSYYGQMLDGVDDAVHQLGWKILAESSRESVEGERIAVESLMDRQCDAVVLHSNGLSDDDLAELLASNSKIVLMNRLVKGFENRCVHVDNFSGGAMAARHLLSRGHREMAVVAGPETFYFEANERLRGFEHELGKESIALDPRNVTRCDFTQAAGDAAFEDLLKRGGTFSAVFFHSDEMAAGGLDAAQRHGVKVPEDISIIGYDDLVIARYTTPKLTTIRQSLQTIGMISGRLAHAICSGGDLSSFQHVIETEVVERASVLGIKTANRAR